MKKKLMILLITALFVAMIFSTGCAKKFDITGIWTLNFNWFSVANSARGPELSSMKGAGAAAVETITFIGDKKSGTFSTSDGYNGTYTVDGKSVSWLFNASVTRYVGTSTDDNTMSGTMTSEYLNGTWSAVR